MGRSSREKKERREERQRQADVQQAKPEPSSTARPKRSNGPLWRFILLFIGLLIAFHVVYYEWIVKSSWFTTYLEASGRVAGFLMNLFGHDVSTYKDTLTLQGFSISIKVGCDGLRPMAILVLAVLSFPMGGKRRLIGIGAGLLMLLFMNVIRIASLLWIGLKSTTQFDLFHLHIWPAFMIVCSLVLFVFWMFWVTKPPPKLESLDATG